MKPNTWNYRIPVVTERKPTADELYLRALKEKHECIIGYRHAGCSWTYTPFQDVTLDEEAASGVIAYCDPDTSSISSGDASKQI